MSTVDRECANCEHGELNHALDGGCLVYGCGCRVLRIDRKPEAWPPKALWGQAPKVMA